MIMNSRVFHENGVYVTDGSDHWQVNSQAFYKSEHIEMTQKNFIRVWWMLLWVLPSAGKLSLWLHENESYPVLVYPQYLSNSYYYFYYFDDD